MLAAYRFPDNLFEDAKVTVDVIFLQKSQHINRDWVNTKKITINGYAAHLNQYFHCHPQHVLGDFERVEVWNRSELTCRRSNRLDFMTELRHCVTQFTLNPAATSVSESQRVAQQLMLLDQHIKTLLFKKQQLLATPTLNTSMPTALHLTG